MKDKSALIGKRKTGFFLALALGLISVVYGCAVKSGYPVYPAPARPEIRFDLFSPRTIEDDSAVYCLRGADLRRLNEYVLRMEGLAKKYECEIRIVNGGDCDMGTTVEDE